MKNNIISQWFWSNVNVKRNIEECWFWRGKKYPNGYGNVIWNGHNFLAHRIAYQITYGNIPENLFILHRCDMPICVNPYHLWIGTQKDNMNDCSKKGRISPYARKGESNPRAKLTKNQIKEIRQRRGNGEKLIQLSNIFKVSITQISLIVRRKSWAHI